MSLQEYIISEETRDIDGLLRFSMENDFGKDSKLNVYIPKANIRFKTQGAGAIRPEKTKIKLTNTVRKIINNIAALNFLQTERVGGKILLSIVSPDSIDDIGIFAEPKDPIVSSMGVGGSIHKSFEKDIDMIRIENQEINNIKLDFGIIDPI